jgi:hypothetical protein
MPTRLFHLIALSACALLMCSCAHSLPTLGAAAPPRAEMPATAAEPCHLFTLKEMPTQADLEIGYATRGAEIVSCNARRVLAVNTHALEHELEDRWAQERADRQRPLWKRLTPWRED